MRRRQYDEPDRPALAIIANAVVYAVLIAGCAAIWWTLGAAVTAGR